MTATIARIAAAFPRIRFAALLARLVEADRRYRDAHKLRGLSGEHLADMRFYRQHGEIRYKG